MLRVALARVGDRPGASHDAPPSWFGASELRRWPELGAAARCAFVDSRWLLRRLLQAETGVDAQRWQVCAEAGTAPVASAPPVDAAPTVSLAHRLGWVAAAVAAPGLGRIGVDVECERPARTDPDERAALMLADDERAAWRRLPESEREPGLLLRWVAKEAWYKAMPPARAAWDFRAVVARPCEPADANVRAWRAGPLVLAVCCADARALAVAHCEGWPANEEPSQSSWHVA